jgi:hypothetical protein
MKNLINSIRQRYQPLDEATMMQDDGKVVHNCAKHVEHAQYGKGNTIAEEHADPDRYGNIAWYDIEFNHGIEKGVPVSELQVLQAESHGHSTKKARKMAEAQDLTDVKKKGMDDEDMDDDEEDDDDDDMPVKGKKKVEEASDLIKGVKRMMSGKKNPSDVRDAHLAKATFNSDPKTKEREGRRYDKVDNLMMKKEDVDDIDEATAGSTPSLYQSKMKSLEKQKKTGHDYFGHDTQRQQSGYRGPGQSVLQTAADKTKKVVGVVAKGLKKVFTKEELELLNTDFPIRQDHDELLPESVDETTIVAVKEYDITEAKKSSGYDAHFRAMMTKHGVKHPGELDTPEKKKAFFNKVDASYSAKNEEVFLEAMLASDLEKIKDAHKKAGNKISNETSGSKAGQAHHSFVVTQPSGKRTRHIYHGSTKKLETMSPAARSKESSEQDLDDK